MTVVASAQPRSTGHPGYNVTLPRAPETAAAARRLVLIAMATWKLDTVVDEAQLVMSELVSNAVRHARGPSVRVIIDRPAADQVFLAVIDRAPRDLPHLQTPGGDGVSGRGLRMVDALTERWGYDLLGPGARPWGKRVWAGMDTKGGTDEHSERR